MALELKDVVVELTSDKLEASFKVTNAADIALITEALISEALANRGVTTGVKQEVITTSPTLRPIPVIWSPQEPALLRGKMKWWSISFR